MVLSHRGFVVYVSTTQSDAFGGEVGGRGRGQGHGDGPVRADGNRRLPAVLQKPVG